MATVNREHKDRLFHFIFGSEGNRAWTLSLYNAVNGSDYTDPEIIQINTIQDVIYLGMHNDVSFLIGNEMNLYEQQSTYNPNIPVRMLQYAGSLFEKYIEVNRLNKYGKRLLKLPVPKLVVFYNGKDQLDNEMVLWLSDSYPDGPKGDIEVSVRMININYGENREILEACEPLEEYAWIIYSIHSKKQNGMDIDTAVDSTILEMPENFVLKPFLTAHKAEVRGMLLTEYNEAETMEQFREEGREEGKVEGREEGREEGRKEGRKELLQLLIKMKESGEEVDIINLSTDKSKLEHLLKKYGIS